MFAGLLLVVCLAASQAIPIPEDGNTKVAAEVVEAPADGGSVLPTTEEPTTTPAAAPTIVKRSARAHESDDHRADGEKNPAQVNVPPVVLPVPNAAQAVLVLNAKNVELISDETTTNTTTTTEGPREAPRSSQLDEQKETSTTTTPEPILGERVD